MYAVILKLCLWAYNFGEREKGPEIAQEEGEEETVPDRLSRPLPLRNVIEMVNVECSAVCINSLFPAVWKMNGAGPFPLRTLQPASTVGRGVGRQPMKRWVVRMQRPPLSMCSQPLY